MTPRRLLATVGIAASLATAGSLLPAGTPEAQAAPNNYGALAWNYQGRTAGAVDYGSPNAAARAAKRHCGSDCGYFTFANSCGAVAFKFGSGGTTVGRAWGYQTRAGAERAARNKAGAGSRVRGWACTTRPS